MNADPVCQACGDTFEPWRDAAGTLHTDYDPTCFYEPGNG